MPAVMQQHGYSGQAWEFRKIWKTYRPAGGLIYKSLEGLNPIDEGDFWHIMESNYRAGLPPPSSFGSIFHRLCRIKWPRKSVISRFRAFHSGGWSMALKRGTFHEKVYHYDLRSAYRWSACCGLPVLKSAKRIFDLDADKSIFHVEFTPGNRPPWTVEETGLITSEELQALKIRPRLLFGVRCSQWFGFSQLFARIERAFPWCYKRISRAFWGRWNGETEVQQHGWKKGHRVRQLPNPLHNPIWSHFITSRVKLRLWEAVQQVGGVHVQVDAVLCRDQLPVSDQPGGWQLVNEYPRGLWVETTGHWGTGQLAVKRMGLKEQEAEQWLIQKR